MNLIERYIFRRAGIATLATLGSLAGVVWIIQALKELDVFTTKGQTILTYLTLTTLAIPMLILAVIPIALLLATVYAVNTMNANSELVVVNASGASNWVLVKPLIVLALLCSLFTGLVGHFVSPWSLLSLKVFTTQMRADLVSVLVREGQFSKIEDGLIFHVARREAFRAEGRVIRLPTISLDDFLKKYNAPRSIDYMSVDTEGSEYEILKTFPFADWDIRLLTIEHSFTPLRQQIRTLLEGHGYVCTEREWDDWYVKAG